MTTPSDGSEDPFSTPQQVGLTVDDPSEPTSSPGLAWSIRGMGVACMLIGLGILFININERGHLLGLLAGAAYGGSGIALALLHPSGRIAATICALLSGIVGAIALVFNPGVGVIVFIPVVIALAVLWRSAAGPVFRYRPGHADIGTIIVFLIAGLILGAAFAGPSGCAAVFLTSYGFRGHH